MFICIVVWEPIEMTHHQIKQAILLDKIKTAYKKNEIQYYEHFNWMLYVLLNVFSNKTFQS